MSNGESKSGLERPQTGSERPQKRPIRQDCIMLWVGLLFIAGLTAVIHGIGHYRGWDAPSGYYHNVSLSSRLRFLPEPLMKNEPFPQYHGRSNRPDVAAQWYYWKNKPDDITIWSRLFAWVAYGLHLISLWVVLYIAQAEKQQGKGKRTTTTLTKYNWISFALNIFFHVLHLVQTHTTYDGLSQDLTVTSPQSSATMLVLMILLLEYNERGLFFGWPVVRYHKDKISQKLTLNMRPILMVRKYHGYAFIWSIVSTIWFHPMENTYGHSMGLFHTWILILQGSLMFTRVHLNHWWRLLLESWVVIHGATVAVQTGKPGDLAVALWPMFLFGFSMVFCFSQIYILPFWYKISKWVRIVPPLVWVAVVIGAYSAIPDRQGRYWVRMQEVIRIPAVYYVAVILIWGFMLLCAFIDRKIYEDRHKNNSTTRRVVYLVFSLLSFLAMTSVSVYLEAIAAPVNMFVLFAGLLLLYALGSGLTCVLLTHCMPKYKIRPKIQPAPQDDEAPNLPEKQGFDNPAMVEDSNETESTEMEN